MGPVVLLRSLDCDRGDLLAQLWRRDQLGVLAFNVGSLQMSEPQRQADIVRLSA